MPTSSLPRRAAARTAALAALTLAGTALAGAPAALAQPGGDNGDVKIHEVGTPFDDQRNEPKVCDFYLAAFNFDPEERVTWTIRTQPEFSGGAQLPNATHPDNTVTIEQDGTAQTIPLALPEHPWLRPGALRAVAEDFARARIHWSRLWALLVLGEFIE